MLSVAVLEGAVKENVADAARLPAMQRSSSRASEKVLDREQVASLLRVCTTRRDRTLVRVAVETGCRRGELAGLNWSAVDLSARRLRIVSAIWQGRTVGKHRKLPKDNEARDVAISADLAAELAAYREELQALGRDVEEGPVWSGRGHRSGERTHDQPMSPDSLSKIVRRLLIKAGLVDDEGKPLLPMKNLRHTAASIPLPAGVPLVVVSAQLGHSRTTTTASFYEHLLNDGELDRFADAFDVASEADPEAAAG